MVHVDEVTNLMDQMMEVDIFRPSEKLRMLKDEEKTFLDPNLIMDARHRVLRENLPASPSRSSVLAEAKKLMTQEETRQMYMKKQQRFLERELKRFELELTKSRPKFSESYACKKRNFAPSDDEDFWGTTRKLRSKTSEQISARRERIVDCIREKLSETDVSSLKGEDKNILKEAKCEAPCIGSIKITIKDKPNFETEAQRLCILRKFFDALKQNAVEEQRLRDIKIKIQQRTVSQLTRKYFDIWRTRTREAKSAEQKRKEKQEVSEERRIEMFINAITEHQRELMKNQKPKIKDVKAVKESSKESEKRKVSRVKHVIVESPAQSRLNAQKQIIEKQKAKLAEQNRIIEELRLRQMQSEISQANRDTVDIAKETLTHCGQKTRRTLVQLMQQNGYRDACLTVPRRPPDPPKFLLRMEARAEARRKRIKLAEESRRQKLEEQRRKEEAVRIEEEQKKRRLQQEAIAEARRLRKEQEENRQREIEKYQRLNNMADEFYRKYLLKRHVLKPLITLVEEKRNNMKKADDHYRENLLRTAFTAWRSEAERQYKMKIEITELIYSKNVMASVFEKWKQFAKEINAKYQVATDFHDMKLLDKYFKSWHVRTIELEAEYGKKVELANNFHENKLKSKYFGTWKRYLLITEEIKETEKRKDELRRLVQKVIPDFDPKQRGVACDE
ncbi:trichohyalin [Ceratina calcarata]|uniref:Trichohyalin n=1 Tax=Ceratina calcarata TaxID=156304 RepID=A0AAJ7SC00_9HYME|nr:trichohyalin [Ceratina calcarata]